MKLLGNLLILLGILFPMHMALGQTIHGEITAGFGGYYRIGKCMPVKVRLENSGRDLSGEIVIQISHSSFAQAVLLPSPSSKTFQFYVVPPRYFQELEIKLFADGIPVKTFTSAVHHVSDEELLVIRSSTLKSVSASGGFPATASRKEKAVFWDPVDFPESWNDYDAVDLVFLDTTDATRLSESQRTALYRWTSLGGIVTLFDHARQTTQFESSGATGILRTTLGLGSFGDGSSVEYGSETRHPYSLLDLDEEIFKALRTRQPISRSGILWIMGAYLFLYGFAIALCLHLNKRLSPGKLWNFALIPAIAILFAAMSPWVGRIVNGGKALVHQNSIVHVFCNSTDAFITNDLALLLPRKATYNLKPASASSYLVQGESESALETTRYEFEDKGVPTASSQPVLGRTKLLSLASFSSQGSFLALRSIDEAAVANRSAFPLHSCVLIRNGVASPLNDMPSGRELRLKLDPAESAPDSSSGRSYHRSMLSKTIDVYQAESLSGTIGDCVICEMAGSIPSLVDNDMGFSYAGSSAVIYHLGKRPVNESISDKK